MAVKMHPINPNKPIINRIYPFLKTPIDSISKTFWPLFTSAVLGFSIFLGRKKFSFNQISYLNSLYKKINFSKFKASQQVSNLKFHETCLTPFGLVASTFCPKPPHILLDKDKVDPNADIIIPNSLVCSLSTLGDFAKPSHNPESPSPEGIAYTQNAPSIDKKDIVIHPEYPIVDLHSIDLMGCDLVSLQLSEKQAKGLLLHFSSLVSQPRKLLELLKPVEEALSIELEKKGISFTEDDNPEFLIEGKGIFVLGPPKEGSLRKKKGRVIDKVLLDAEQKIGLNQQGSPIFVGFVDPEKANPFVMEGNTFKEDVSVSSMILHGKNSHRLAILAFAASLKGTEFEDISPKAILTLLIQAKIANRSAWTVLLDSNKNILWS
ncbi:MAG: hypothetical protein JSS09_06645, partial [Verrucomicrobia bacterium]|nr:hypothetical protein [Verrucomicrobiota bacterium]